VAPSATTDTWVLAQSLAASHIELIMIQVVRLFLLGLAFTHSVGSHAELDSLAMNLSEFNLPEFNEYSVPVVLTATRLQQHQADVPASVTILDEHFIKQIGAQSLAELFRYVPGMMVGPDNNNNSDAVHYHGGPASLPKNLQVLINGRSMYRSGLAAVSWYEMPVALEDIKRIEVVRGPNAASYGANAFQAVINILTKHPADTYGSTVSLQGGNNGEENVYLKQGGRLGSSDYRVSFSKKNTDGFEVENDSRMSQFVDFEHYYQGANAGELETSVVLLDSKRQIIEPFDYQTNVNEVKEQRIEVGTRWTKDFSSKHQVQVSAYASRYNQIQTLEVRDVPVPVFDQDLKSLFDSSPLFIEGEKTSVDAFKKEIKKGDQQALNYYSTLSAADKAQLGFINIYSLGQPALVSDFLNAYDAEYGRTDAQKDLTSSFINTYSTSIDPSSLVGGQINADLDEYRYDIEIQDTYVYSPTLTFVTGASFRRDEVNSQTYFNGRLKNDTTRLFASASWKAGAAANLHLGLMAEEESDADLVFAPRAALNYKFTPNQSMRVVYSEAVRSPDLFEQNAHWSLTLENPTSANLNGTTFYQTQQGPDNLDHQYIRSYELGYYGRFNQLNSEMDIRLFYEDLTDVFYQSLTLEEIETINNIEMQFQGVEVQLSMSPCSKGQLRWVGAYVDADTNVESVDPTSVNREQVLLRVYARNTHTLSWLQRWGESASSSVSYILANEYDDMNINKQDRSLLERIDVKLLKTLNMPDMSIDLTANLQHDLSSDPYIWGVNMYEKDTRIQFSAALNF